jgi:hypothetical protein
MKQRAELSDYAHVPFSNRFSANAYIRSVDSLWKQAMVYKEEGNLEEAFIHAAKAALLAVEHLYVYVLESKDAIERAPSLDLDIPIGASCPPIGGTR